MAQSHQHLHRRHAKPQEAEMGVLVKRDPLPEPQTTVLSVVYVTASPTFTGAVGGYTTIGLTSSSQASPTTQVDEPQAASSSEQSFVASPSSVDSTTQGAGVYYSVTGVGSSSKASASPSSFTTVSPTSAVATSLIASTAAVTQFSTADHNTAVAAASATASSSSQSSASSSSGMSTGAKIGIAVGVIILLVAVAVGILLAYWNKKKQHEEHARQDDEKAALATTAAAATAIKGPSPAPRLSLRPMSRLMRLSGGNLLNNVNAPIGAQNGPGRTLTPSPNMTMFTATGPRTNSPREAKAAENPFNDPQNPFSDPEKGTAQPQTAGPAANAAGAGMAGAAAAGAMAARNIDNTSSRNASPEPMAGAAGSPDAPSNVHRVQLDFKPSMDDELELKAGQLVRMLHEYDDGWALCIRLDRSQQGVAPRTCLSPKPCKPRPNAGPNSPGPRGPGMNGPNGRSSPAMNGRMSPAMGPPSGRMSPAMGPPNGRMSPAMGPQGGRMSPAMGPPNGRMSPAMARPGPPQARPMSPAGARGSPRMAPQHQQGNSIASINQFNQGPRPLSPGPGLRGPAPRGQRSQSPGPYGANQGPRSMGGPSRRRSNSTGGALIPQGRMSPAPLNPSRLNPAAPGQWPLPAAGSRPA